MVADQAALHGLLNKIRDLGLPLVSLNRARSEECEEKKIEGKEVTPFLLKRIVELSKGKSLETNIALALSNVKLAAEIAKQIK